MRVTRRGNVLIMVGIFGILVSLAVFALSFLTKTDASTTVNLLRELHATYLAEGIAAQIEAQVNSRPWNQRFWRQPTGPQQAALNRTSQVINLANESLPTDEYDFVGIIKDITGELRQYRLYLEVTVRGETYTFSWDKRHELSLLSGLSRDATEFDKVVETEGGDTANDALLTGIRTEGVNAEPTDRSPPTQRERRKGLRKDRKSHRARATLPDSGAAPSDPGETVRQVSDMERGMRGKGGGGN